MIDLFSDLMDWGRHTMFEPYDSLVAGVHDNHLRAAETLTDDYKAILEKFQEPDVTATAAEWAQEMATLQPALESYLRGTATASWRGRGLTLPDAAARERYVQQSAARALNGLNDIRKRYQSATEGKAGRASVDEYLARSPATAASIAARASDYLYAQYEATAAAKGQIVGRVWRNEDPTDSRHAHLEGETTDPNTPWIDPEDGQPIVPRMPRGGQDEFSGSSAVIRYTTADGQEL